MKDSASSRRSAKSGGSTVFQFVDLSADQGCQSQQKAKQVRAHAARNPRARQKRVLEYQASKASRASQCRQAEAEAAARVHPKADSWDLACTRPPAGCNEQTWDHHAEMPPEFCTYFNASRADPFDSLVCKLTWREWFLFDHFMRYVLNNSQFCVPGMSPAEQLAYRVNMGQWWAQRALSDIGMLSAMLQVACSNLAALDQPGPYAAMSLRYGMICITSLREELARSSTSPGDLSLAKTMALASDAIQRSDFDAAAVYTAGLEKLVALRGEANISRAHFPGKMLIWYIKDPCKPHHVALVTPKCIGTMAAEQDCYAQPIHERDG